MKEFFHKATGVVISEPSKIYLVASGAYKETDFEEALNLGASRPVSLLSGEIPSRLSQRVVTIPAK